jgi:hypothetical protein
MPEDLRTYIANASDSVASKWTLPPVAECDCVASRLPPGWSVVRIATLLFRFPVHQGLSHITSPPSVSRSDIHVKILPEQTDSAITVWLRMNRK